MKHTIFALSLAVAAAAFAPALAQDKGPQIKVDQAKIEAAYADMFKEAKGEWAKRPIQDAEQKLCSQTRNQLSDADFKKMQAAQAKTVKYPKDGKVIGDWRSGEKIAQSGFGGRFNDRPNTINGGNCYACHQMSKKELSYGTLGPSLVEYGKSRDYSEKEAKLTYAKIYNSWSVQPCSNMPRFGFHNFLSEQQIKDVVALLFAKDSPVNK
ncbi:MAG: sulfur oxidation c-type cytochrome SoxX [Beijerinckiaceae bacterium]